MSDSFKKTGVLLVNLGTPEAPDRASTKRFLKEFLSDPRVIEVPKWLWQIILNLIILPFRSGRSAKAYQSIWMKEGSPLMVYSRALAEKLDQQPSTKDMQVKLAMRYGEPSIAHTMSGFKEEGVERILLLPLYPQYSATTTASVFDAVADAMQSMRDIPELITINQYYQHPLWVSAIADSIQSYQQVHGKPDRLLFSLHGIPQRYADAGDPYPVQCQDSVQRVAEALGLDKEQWMLTYQSRVGREPWLMPYTDHTLEALAKEGVKHVQVVCPGFAVDCLETLEEIAEENRELFIEAGGESLEYIPALNDSDEHVQLMQALVDDYLPTDKI